VNLILVILAIVCFILAIFINPINLVALGLAFFAASTIVPVHSWTGVRRQ
jgi:hypothetical protein